MGAQDVDGAYTFINWMLTADELVPWAIGPGGGLPTLKSVMSAPDFQTPYYKQAAAALAVSVCKPQYPTIADTKGAGIAIAAVVYNLVKQSPNADVATTLQKAQDDYNKNIP